jgi:hypothetical protein
MVELEPLPLFVFVTMFAEEKPMSTAGVCCSSETQKSEDDHRAPQAILDQFWLSQW